MNEVFSIWGSREGYVSLPRKLLSGKEFGSKNNKGSWEEQCFTWNNTEADKKKIEQWVHQSIEAGYNIYWCPTVLDNPRRVKESISKVDCFYADLDEIPLSNLDKIPIKPTILWETSKGRYSAVWKLQDGIDSDVAEMVNKHITYQIGADPGGWDLTQVLRVPRSLNFKYEKPFRGKVLSYEYKPLSAQNIQPLIIKALKEVTTQPGEQILEFEENPFDLNFILSDYNLPKHLLQLINLSEDYILTQDRSKRLWQIESQLKECGVTRDDCISIILKSNWNKYKGRKDEYARVITEVDKVYSQESKSLEKSDHQFKLISYNDFMSQKLPKPQWLIEEWWQKESHGMISGEPKTYKSTIVTDMMVSVASGKPFLGKFPVHHTGPVIYIQEENAPVLVKDRVMKVATSRDLYGKVDVDGSKVKVQMPEDLPIYFMNNEGFDLTDDDSRNALHEAAEQIKPVLVVFDPLYLMLGDKDENSSKDVRDVLRWLVGFRYKHNTAVIVLHHWNKNSKTERGGQRMLGSTLFHAWVESALYCSIANESQQEIAIERELRSFHKPDKVVIKLIMGEPGDTTYDVKLVGEVTTRSESIMSLLAQYPDGLTEAKICTILSVNKTKAKEEIIKLFKENKILIEKKGNTINYKMKGESKNG